MKKHALLFALLLSAITFPAAAAETSFPAPMPKAPTGEDCPDTGWQEDIVPGFDPNHKEAFSKFGIVAACGAYAVADQICVDLKRSAKNGKSYWPNKTEPLRGCSPMDLQLQLYSNMSKAPPISRPTYEGFLNGDGQEITQLVETAKQNGICPEEAFPNELIDADPKVTMANICRMAKAKVRNAQSHAEGDIPSVGSEPSLSLAQWKQIADLFGPSCEYREDEFQVLSKINHLACDGKRISLPPDYNYNADFNADRNKTLRNLNSHLWAHETAILALDAYDILKSTEIDGQKIPVPPGSIHFAIILGAMNGAKVKDAQSQTFIGKGCYYAVKNPWGPHACKKETGLDPRSPDILCDDKTGVFYLSTRKMQSILKVGGLPFYPIPFGGK